MGMTLDEKCRLLPPSGGGGAHPALLGAANTGVRLGHTDGEILSAIRNHLDDSARPITDKEILDTINTARNTDGKVPNRGPWNLPPLVAGTRLLNQLISESSDATGSELINLSPVPISGDPDQQTIQFLSHSYLPEEFIFCGPAMSGDPKHLTTATEPWQGALPIDPWYIINPLTGREAQKADSGMSYRCDNAVSDRRYMLWEMDSVPVPDQIRFWTTVVRRGLLPVQSVAMSGGKSIHALIRVDARTSEEWDLRVRGQLLKQVAVLLGADGACGNPSRMSRLPGRCEAGRGVQWLLYLDDVRRLGRSGVSGSAGLSDA